MFKNLSNILKFNFFLNKGYIVYIIPLISRVFGPYFKLRTEFPAIIYIPANTDHIFFEGKVTIQFLYQLCSRSNKARLKSGKAKSTSQSSGFTDSHIFKYIRSKLGAL